MISVSRRTGVSTFVLVCLSVLGLIGCTGQQSVSATSGEHSIVASQPDEQANTGLTGAAGAAADDDHDHTAIGAIDQRSLAQPARNSIYSCNLTAMGTALDRPWVDENGTIYFELKPVIEGAVSWDSQFSITVDYDGRHITGNGLPDHTTGEYPVSTSSEAAQYDRNPNSIGVVSIDYTIPANPTLAASPACLPMGVIGVALSGGVFYNALDADARDAVANELFDSCEGHPQQRGQYHYHHDSPCFDQGDPGEHSPLVGYALDGFGIYGSQDVDGHDITNAELDVCHGHTGAVPTEDGGTEVVYHYHLNDEFPYSLGCFSGTVDLSGVPAQGGSQPSGQQPGGQGQPGQGQGQPPVGGPPPGGPGGGQAPSGPRPERHRTQKAPL